MGILSVRVVHMGHEEGKFSFRRETAVYAQATYRIWTGRKPWRYISLHHHEHCPTDGYRPDKEFTNGYTRHGEEQQPRLEMGDEDHVQHRCRPRLLRQPSDAHSRVLLFEDHGHALCLRGASASVCLQHPTGEHRRNVKPWF